MIHPHAQQGLLWRWLDAGRHFVIWLFLDVPLGIFRSWQSTAANFESQIAVITTAKNITKPLFQDYTREGRLIGFFMRVVRIIIGVIVQIVVAIAFIILFIIWYILPFYLIWQIVRNGFGLFTP